MNTGKTFQTKIINHEIIRKKCPLTLITLKVIVLVEKP